MIEFKLNNKQICAEKSKNNFHSKEANMETRLLGKREYQGEVYVDKKS